MLKENSLEASSYSSVTPGNTEVKEDFKAEHSFGPTRIEDVLPDFDGKKWYQLGHIWRLIGVIITISLVAANNGYDGSLLNALYTGNDFNNAIGNVTGAVLGAMSNGFVFGCIITFFITPKIVDDMGRKKALYIGDIVMVIGTVLQGCSGAWINGLPEKNTKKDVFGMLLVSRIILGIGSGILSVAGPSLISEISYPTHRQTVTTMYNSTWYLGAIIAAWVSFGCRNMNHHWSWRTPSIVQGFFPLLQICLLFAVPESPRFLVSKGRDTEAREILMKFHAGNDEIRGGALVDYELTEIKLAIQQERMFSEVTSYSDFFRTSANRKRLWILCWVGVFMQLSGNGLVSYYLGKVLTSIGIKSGDEQLIVNGGLMVYNWGVSLILALFVLNHLTRKAVFNISVGGMLLCFTIWTVLSAINQQRDFEDKSLGKGVLAMIFFYYLFYNFGLNGYPFLYVTEILPYSLRGKGLNIFTIVQYTVMIYNGFVNPIAMDAIEWKYYIVYCCILVVEFCICFFTFVETSGRTLEEVSEVFGDGISNMTGTTTQMIMEEGKFNPEEEVEHRE